MNDEKYVVCEGAVCQCIYGSTPDMLVVNSHKKLHVSNGRIAGTTQELGQTFENNSFGSCAKNNNHPCTVALTEWKGFHEKGGVDQNGVIAKILIEDSAAACPIGGSGCIKVRFHGQEVELSKRNYHTADSELHQTLNPAGDIESIQQEAEELYDFK